MATFAAAPGPIEKPATLDGSDNGWVHRGHKTIQTLNCQSVALSWEVRRRDLIAVPNHGNTSTGRSHVPNLAGLPQRSSRHGMSMPSNSGRMFVDGARGTN